MKRYKDIFIIVGVLAAGVALGAWTRGAFLKNNQTPSGALGEKPSESISKTANAGPCASVCAPDGSLTRICPVALTPSMAPVEVAPALPFLNNAGPPLVSAGTGTTTLKKDTPFNDILIAESGSPYAGMRNARYTMWPYPGEIPFKEVYLVLPDSYEPLFPGYSNKQFVEIGETKNIMLYVRRRGSIGAGADARILISAPTTTEEKDHPLEVFDKTDSWEGFSLVARGHEVVVEIILTPTPGSSLGVQNAMREELTQAVLGMEIVW